MFNTKSVVLKTLVVVACLASWLTVGVLLNDSIATSNGGPIRVCGSIG